MTRNQKQSPHRSFLILLVVALSATFITRCDRQDRSQVTDQQRDRIVAEVQQRLDQYAAAVTRKDVEAMLSFWSDSDDFVFAGDGSILGGFDAWAPVTRRDNDETQRWLYWNWRNVHILPLSLDAASATVEFEYSKISLQGNTVSGKGAWTYVLRRDVEGWKVVQSNGTHLQR